jgi:hypothetical protein
MTTIEISLQDDLIQLFGLECIRCFIDEELAYQRFRLLEMGIFKVLSNAKNIDWDQEFEKARQDAFNEYQIKRKLAS